MRYQPQGAPQETVARIVNQFMADQRVVIAAGNRLTLIGMCNARHMSERCVGGFTCQSEVIDSLSETSPTLLITHEYLEEGSGLSLIREMRRLHPDCKVLLFLERSHEGVISDALSSGADGICIVSQLGEGQFLEAVLAIAKGSVFFPESVRGAVLEDTRGGEKLQMLSELTDREREVLACVAEGRSNAEICSCLQISLATCKSHISALTGKLQVSSRTQLAVLALRKGLVP